MGEAFRKRGHRGRGMPGATGKEKQETLFRPNESPDGSFCQFFNCNLGAFWDLSSFPFLFLFF